MRRPWTVITVAAVEILAGLALVGAAVYLLVEAKEAGEAYGLVIIAASILGLMAVLMIVSCWALWKSKAWGWWLALVTGIVGLVTFLWDPVARRVAPDVDELAFIFLFAVLVGLLLLAPVRGFLLKKGEAQTLQASAPLER